LHAVVPRRDDLDRNLLEVVEEELNIKEVRFLTHAEELVTHRATPNFRVLGKRFGARTPQAAEAIRSLPSAALAEFLRGGALRIELEGESHTVSSEEVDVREEARGNMVVEAGGAFTVALDPAIDEALRLEGLARETVNRIQRMRREAGLAVSDRIRLFVSGDGVVRQMVAYHGDVIARETLALSIDVGEHEDSRAFTAAQEVDLDGVPAWIALERA
jgi:isoleucyl-tRNA synthetase